MPRECSRAEAEARSDLLHSIAYTVTLDFTQPSRVRSLSEVRFSAFADGADTFAQLDAASIRALDFNGEALDPAVFHTDGRIKLQSLRPENLLTVESEHVYESGGAAFSREIDSADEAAYVMAYAYPTDASRIFCCFDQPDLAGSFRISLILPAGWVPVSHTAAASRLRPDGGTAFELDAIARMKPQELLVVAGSYATVLERPPSKDLPGLRVLCRRSIASGAQPERLADLAERAIGYYARLFQVPCPYDRLDMVFVPGLSPLAVLVPALMGLNEVIFHRVSDPEDDFVAMIVAHEVAHLWFGCVADCRWWDDLWLAEALATWASYEAGEHAVGMHAAWAGFAIEEKERAYAADRLPTTEPVASPVETAAEAMARPSAVMYCKGASAVRQLGVLIGGDALRDGLRNYLDRFADTPATSSDIVACWSETAGTDLTRWSHDWLMTPGANVLQAEIAAAADGAIAGLAVLQEAPAVAGIPQPLRTHRLTVGLYQLDGGRLRRAATVATEVRGGRTELAAPLGVASCDAVVVNAEDETYARLRFDAATLAALEACAVRLDSELTESVCWNTLWDMTLFGELGPDHFVRILSRRFTEGGVPLGARHLARRAIAAIDEYLPGAARSGSRELLASSCGIRLRTCEPSSRTWRDLAESFASAAETPEQVAELRRWIDGSLPHSQAHLDVRRQALRTLAARGLATQEDLSAFAAEDPVGGALTGITCRAMQPDVTAKLAAWGSALDVSLPLRVAEAHAEGIWVAGQEDLAGSLHDRFFDEVLPLLRQMPRRRAERLGAALFPLLVGDSGTLVATRTALARDDTGPVVRALLLERQTMLERAMAARARYGGS